MLTEKEISVLKLAKQGLKQIDMSKKLKISQPAVSGLYRNAIRKIEDAYGIVALSKEMGVKK